MSPSELLAAGNATEEISALIEVLHRTGQRLEELTAGEVDTVADSEGRTFVLRHAQEQLRHTEATRQAAILNALPAHIALLDPRGFVISVNAAWRDFADANAMHGPGHGIGANYLAICDRARGNGASEAAQVAGGIRAVLDGKSKSFSIEYPCHSPTEQRWFLLTVTPLAEDSPKGAIAMHLNITERKQAESALGELTEQTQRRERLLNTTLSNISDFAYAYDREGRFLFANRPLLDLWGITLEAAVGKTFSELGYPPDLAARLKRQVQEVFDTKRSITDETAYTSPAGLPGYYEYIFSPVVAIDGSVEFVVGSTRDVTERIRSAETLRTNEREQRQLAAQLEIERSRLVTAQRVAKVGSWETDLATMAVIWSEETHRIHETDPATFRPTHSGFLDIVHPGDRPRLDEAFAKSIAERGGYKTIEHRLLLPEGRIKFVEERWQIVHDIDNKPVRAIGTCQDITERHLSEQAIEGALQRLTEAQSIGQIGDWEYDIATQAITWSAQVFAILGRDPAAGPPRNYAENAAIFDAQSIALQDEKVAQALATGQAQDYDLVALHPNGERIQVHGRAVPRMGENGRIVSLRGTVQDISARKRSEALLMQSEVRIKRLNRVYAVMNRINAAIIRIRDRNELFQEACRIIVEHGHFILGWIAVLDHSTGKLTAVAQAGLSEQARVDSDFFNGTVGLVPAGVAEIVLREQRSVFDNVIENLPGITGVVRRQDSLKVRQAAIELGAKSVIGLPLIVDAQMFGILHVYASEQDFFDAEEVKLLNDLAGDISFGLEFIAKEEKVDYLAYYDVLTGLSNRSLFLERVAQYMRGAATGGHRLALFLFDLERFKNINDSLGRLAGDALLKQVAQWLTLNLGDANLFARVDADHFAIVLPQIRQEGDVTRLVEKTMRAFMEHPFRLNDAVFRIAAKVGAAFFPEDGADADTLFRNAEAALKKAKASGERYLFYTQRMTETVAVKLTLENQLRQALDNEEFVLHYQPKVTLAHNKLTGAEALIRWNDPRTGLVPPGHFIPILEETGLIYEVGRWALRKAIEDFLRWHAMGLGAVRIAVNVSPLQLRNRGFVSEIREVVGIGEQAAAGLELEITESLIMEDVRHNISSLHAIRELGIGIAIDDFGTGFSSLSYLAKLPVDTLKIDRSFVADMTAAQQGLALVSTIINLAHSLKLNVVAEGVETDDQSRLLRLLNCDEMQGYLFSKPVPAELFEATFLSPKARP